MAYFNNALQQELRPLVFEIDKKDKAKQKKLLEIKPPLLTKILLAIPAAIGFFVHVPLYLPVKYYVWKIYGKTVHVDSMLIAITLFSYPVYLLVITLLAFVIFNTGWVFLLIIFLPFTAWSYVQLKGQLDK